MPTKEKWAKMSLEQKQKHLENCKKWQEANKEKRLQSKKLWADKNKEYHKTYKKIWAQKNKAHVNAQTAARRRKVRIQMPVWADLKAIQDFYLNCPEGHHVDHVIPLNGKIVSGLHVLENLQYLPELENLRKSNTYAVST